MSIKGRLKAIEERLGVVVLALRKGQGFGEAPT